MPSYGWKITHDHLDHVRVSVYGPRGITDEQVAILDNPSANLGKVVKFRIYDADRELYYSGLFVGDWEAEDGFGPLDDYGTPNAGATDISYQVDPNNDRWEFL